jgi:dCTP deaminase
VAPVDAELAMSILSGPAIRAAIERGDIVINPFDSKYVNPASVDLTLGTKVARYANERILGKGVVLDSKKDNPCEFFDIEHGGVWLYPGHLYLMHTAECVRTDKYVPVLDGKSSIGRLGVQVHMTAGYGDPGFDGQYTLEVTAVYPTRVYAGMRFCQMRFHELSCGDGRLAHASGPGTKAGAWKRGEEHLYNGNYTGEASMGPVPSRSWKQFE